MLRSSEIPEWSTDGKNVTMFLPVRVIFVAKEVCFQVDKLPTKTHRAVTFPL